MVRYIEQRMACYSILRNGRYVWYILRNGWYGMVSWEMYGIVWYLEERMACNGIVCMVYLKERMLWHGMECYGLLRMGKLSQARYTCGVLRWKPAQRVVNAKKANWKSGQLKIFSPQSVNAGRSFIAPEEGVENASKFFFGDEMWSNPKRLISVAAFEQEKSF